MKAPASIACAMLCLSTVSQAAAAQAAFAADGPLAARPWVIGILGGGGTAIADHVSIPNGRAAASLNFASAGIRFGKVIGSQHGEGVLRNRFEVSSELDPFWQATYPKQELIFHDSGGVLTDPRFGYTIRGVNLIPVQLRIDFTKRAMFVPWFQVACGVLWTASDFPTIHTASVNFTPQAGFGAHFFTHRHQSVDLAVNAVHISNGDTADQNPGVNISIQTTLGYSWWLGRSR